MASHLHLVRQLVPSQFHFLNIFHVRHIECLALSRNFQSAITEQCANNRPTDLKATDAVRVQIFPWKEKGGALDHAMIGDKPIGTTKKPLVLHMPRPAADRQHNTGR